MEQGILVEEGEQRRQECGGMGEREKDSVMRERAWKGEV